MKVIHFSLKCSCTCTKITNRKMGNQFCRLNLVAPNNKMQVGGIYCGLA